ncbi:hypothetical protein M0R45_013555 [Rubus argutus]|uniref:X8 domain-containing protein n=1 Tax=Rubus argutus TaxID=59490 RepID=A0AAW1XJH0_RUBAR
MAKAESSFSILILFLLQVLFFHKVALSSTILPLLFLFFILGRMETSTVECVKTWCVAKPSTSREVLENNLQYACNNINTMDCKEIQEGGPLLQTS